MYGGVNVSITVEAIMNLPVMEGSYILSNTGRNNTVQLITVAEAPKVHFPNYNEGILL